MKGKIEYTPTDEPAAVEGEYVIYPYRPENGIVPDLIITTTEKDEQVRLWGYQGHNGVLVLVLHTVHYHPPDFPDSDCQKWSVFADDEFPPLSEAPETPDKVNQLAAKYSDAPVADKSLSEKNTILGSADEEQ